MPSTRNRKDLPKPIKKTVSDNELIDDMFRLVSVELKKMSAASFRNKGPLLNVSELCNLTRTVTGLIDKKRGDKPDEKELDITPKQLTNMSDEELEKLAAESELDEKDEE